MMKTEKPYVYTLSYPNTEPFIGLGVFYVGKGRGDRMHQHENSFSLKADSPKNRAIRAIHKAGLRVVKTKIHVCTTDEEAYILENQTVRRMRALGYSLTNLTNGGRGGKPLSRKLVLDEMPASVVESGKIPTERERMISLRLALLPEDLEPAMYTGPITYSLDEMLDQDLEYEFRSLW